MRRRCFGMSSLAVIVILLMGEVPEAASTTDGGSINVPISIAEFIWDEEFLMESEVNARLLQVANTSDDLIDQALNKNKPVCNATTNYGNGTCLVPTGGTPPTNCTLLRYRCRQNP
ncbi:hypothetical protein SLE2022_190800 [Rubroshorea leprosula]